jgi:hypothetical protein
MKALMLKELRETVGLAALALVCYLALVANLTGAKLFDWVPQMPHGTYEVPFTGSEFLSFFTIVSAVFVLALGFRQSAWESARGTYLFLLHRPLPRHRMILAKLATGIGIFLVCAAVPILLYAWWAAIPGHHASPFFWSMTGPAWQLWFLMPLLYLGAFLSGLRPARWYGTRLLPLVAVVPLLALLNFVPWWWSLGFPVALVLYVLLVANVCYVAQVRDYA